MKIATTLCKQLALGNGMNLVSIPLFTSQTKKPPIRIGRADARLSIGSTGAADNQDQPGALPDRWGGGQGKSGRIFRHINLPLI